MVGADRITRLNRVLEGRYQVERELGEGGMANVYVAEDLKHHRQVALKVLKPELAAVIGAERFLAEIEMTANLQHPNILPLHDSGEADGLLFYVMPYVDGESLRERLDREHQLPVEDAVRIATEVAEALEHAHRHGVLHRDIKPANVLLQDGRPVISDFGIALAVSRGGGDRLTETGLSLGTPHYMSPEQATGDTALGPATDVYSLGCVLHEMLTGEPPHTGSTPQAVLGRIITEPAAPVRRGRPSVPAHVEATVARALEKIPADRFQSAVELGRALADPGFRHGPHGSRADAVRPGGLWKAIAAGALTLSVALAGAFLWLLSTRAEPTAPAYRFPSPFLEGQRPNTRGPLKLTPDGSAIVYPGPAESEGEMQLWIRRWASLDALPIPDTRFSQGITFAISPDGTEVAFIPLDPSSQPLMIASMDEGTVRPLGVSGFGVSAWTADGWIYFLGGGSPEIHRVSEAGSRPERITERAPREFHLAYVPLPGGSRGIVEVQDREDPWASAELRLVSADAEGQERLTAGHTPRLAPTGDLLFVTDEGTLMAAPMDDEGRPRVDDAVVALESTVHMEPPFGLAQYDISEEGTLVYTIGSDVEGRHEFVWVDREGQASPVPSGPSFLPGVSANMGWKLSPDHRSVAFQRSLAGNTDIYTLALEDGTVSRLTFDPADDWSPRWSHDGSSITFFSTRGAEVRTEAHLWIKAADGGGQPRPLHPDVPAVVGVWSPDGEWLVLRTPNVPGGDADILWVRPGTDTVAAPLVAGNESREWGPVIAPDGRWLAYHSDETGRNEVYVRPFPDTGGGKWQASTDGGTSPIWAHSGRELFYFDPQARTLMVAEYRPTSTFELGGRDTLFTVPSGFVTVGDFYDVSADDQRFLMARIRPGGTDAQVVLVQNFLQHLRDLREAP